MTPFEELVHEGRGAIGKGIVLAVDDSGAVQTALVQCADGVTRAGVEIGQPFGLASSPPSVGADILLFAVGADPSHLVGMITAPALRFGNLNRGEVALYGATGARVHIRQGGNIDIRAGATLAMTATEIVLTGLVRILGNLSVTGAIDATGTIRGA